MTGYIDTRDLPFRMTRFCTAFLLALCPNRSQFSLPPKPGEYDKHPNEVVKNEELTYNSAASATIGAGGRHSTTTSSWWHRLALTALLSLCAAGAPFWAWSQRLARLLLRLMVGTTGRLGDSSGRRRRRTLVVEVEVEAEQQQKQQHLQQQLGADVIIPVATEAAVGLAVAKGSDAEPPALAPNHPHQQQQQQQQLRWRRWQQQPSGWQSAAAERPSSSCCRCPSNSSSSRTTTSRTTTSRTTSSSPKCQR